MLATWVLEEVKDVNFEDKRLNARMAKVLDQLGGRPTASIPAACNGWTETLAAYRFFDNEKVTFERILEPHIEASYRRIADQPVVILIQDTTEIDLTRPKRDVAGAGPLGVGARRGALLHPLIGFTPQGTPLGTVYAEAWTRDEVSVERMTKKEKQHARKHKPIEDKESVRWLDAMKQAQAVAEFAPETQCVCVADSEGDIYEVLEEGQQSSIEWIIRSGQNRAVKPTCSAEADPTRHLRERVLSTKCLFTNKIHARGRESLIADDTQRRRQPRQSRDATVEVRAAKVELRAPWRHDRKLEDLSVHVVLVTEPAPPDGEIPVEWMLVTSLPIDDPEQVRKVVQYYSVRWMIEVYFRTLKSTCRVEERQFETIERALNALAVYMIVAWRALMVCRISREYPDESCEILFEPEEWKSVSYIVHQKPPPDRPPTLREMVRMLGWLGGYLDRNRDDEPGPQTVALGLQRAHDITNCWNTFGPEAKKPPSCV